MHTYLIIITPIVRAIALALFVSHLFEEQGKPGKFREEFNAVFKALFGLKQLENFPLSQKVNLWRNTVGLAVGGSALIIASAWWPIIFAVFIGFIAADSLTHIWLSVKIGWRLTSGIRTTGLFYIPAVLLYLFFAAKPNYWLWAAAAGAFALLFTYFQAAWQASQEKKHEIQFS